MMHKCQSMLHWWQSAEDARKCCQPQFRRVFDPRTGALVWEPRGKQLGTQELRNGEAETQELRKTEV